MPVHMWNLNVVILCFKNPLQSDGVWWNLFFLAWIFFIAITLVGLIDDL